MTGGNKLKKDFSLKQLEHQIINYLGNLPPKTLNITKCHPVEILTMTPGAYNLNYHVIVGGKRFVFRVNVQPQSGLSNQIYYEFQVMRFLEPYQITAKVFHCNTSKTHFMFDILIEEYLEGPWVSLNEVDMTIIASLLARLHSLDTNPLQLISWNDPLVDTVRLIEFDLAEYQSKKSAISKVINLTEHFLRVMKSRIEKKRRLFIPDGLNHTDVAIDNFVKTTQGLKLIDWEKPRFDDCSYDICCFLAEPAQLWCTPHTLSQTGREIFINEYVKFSGKDEGLLREKILIREPLVALHWIFWGMNRKCDLQDQTTATALQQVHEERVSRWERIADPLLIEKLIDNL